MKDEFKDVPNQITCHKDMTVFGFILKKTTTVTVQDANTILINGPEIAGRPVQIHPKKFIRQIMLENTMPNHKP